MKTVQYSSQRRGTPNLHLLSHPLTLRRCNLSNESNCIVCRDAPLEFLNLPWCPSPVTGIAVVPSLTQTFPRQELQCPMTNEIRPLQVHLDPWIVNELSVTLTMFLPAAGLIFSSTMRMTIPLSSRPRRPARPLIWMYSPDVILTQHKTASN